MNWLEISIVCDGERAEAVSELFNRYANLPGARGGAVVEVSGFDAVGELTEPTVTVRTYLDDSDDGRALCRKIEEGLWHLSQVCPLPEPQVRELQEQDWSEAWKSHYRPLRVGQRLVICPSWLEPEAGLDDLVIELDPGMAFGSGLHPSTRLGLMLLEEHVHPGERVLDVGTGSGILAIAAARLGAGPVLGLDVDRVAVEVARENVAHNGLDDVVSVQAGSVPTECAPTRGWDVVVVNILADVIAELLADGLAGCLAPEGRLILSGIIASRLHVVEQALSRQHLKITQRLEEGDWVGLVAKR